METVHLTWSAKELLF